MLVLKGNCVNHGRALLRMLCRQNLCTQGQAPRPPHHPITPSPWTHLLTKGRESNGKWHFWGRSLQAYAGRSAGPQASGLPRKGPGHHVYIGSLLSVCLGSWRSRCCSWDLDNFILFSCIYLAFPNPMWLYGYDFGEFQSGYSWHPTKKNTEKTVRWSRQNSHHHQPPLHSCCWIRPSNSIPLNID